MRLVNLTREILAKTQWFLDFDGSLCPHLEVWQERSYDPARILRKVSELHRQSRGVFWNTGRRVESLGGIHASYLEFPGYFIHGSTRWTPDSKSLEVLAPTMPSEIVDRIDAALKNHRELRLEKKPTGIRVAPFDPVSQGKVQDFFESADFFATPGWEWTIGARGAELLAAGFNKGTPLRRECIADVIPIAIGDDTFDGPAFEEAIQRGGFAIMVGEHCGFATKIAHQSWQLIYCDDSDEVINLLGRLLDPA